MRRTRVRWGRVAALAAAVVIAATAGGVAHAGGGPRHLRQPEGVAVPHRSAVRLYVVRPGDTLWAIAVRLAGPGADPRPMVEDLAAANRTAGALVPGQTLRLPR
jgi:nucleoid-associated protein YgaU